MNNNGTNPKNLTINELREEAVREYKQSLVSVVNRIESALAANMINAAQKAVKELQELIK